MVDNPAYREWVRFKVGTTISYSVHMRRQSEEGEGLALSQKLELIALDDQKAVVKTSGSVKIMLLTMPVPIQHETYPARIRNDSQADDTRPSQVPRHEVIKGRETIEAGGRSFDCAWGEVDLMRDGKRMHGRSWVCSDVPGGVVKWEGTTQDAQGRVIEMKMLLTDLRLPP